MVTERLHRNVEGRRYRTHRQGGPAGEGQEDGTQGGKVRGTEFEDSSPILPPEDGHFLARVEALLGDPREGLNLRSAFKPHFNLGFQFFDPRSRRSRFTGTQDREVFRMVDQQLGKIITGSDHLESAAKAVRLGPGQSKPFRGGEKRGKKTADVSLGPLRERYLARQPREIRGLRVEVSQGCLVRSRRVLGRTSVRRLQN